MAQSKVKRIRIEPASGFDAGNLHNVTRDDSGCLVHSLSQLHERHPSLYDRGPCTSEMASSEISPCWLQPRNGKNNTKLDPWQRRLMKEILTRKGNRSLAPDSRKSKC
jgi:hypothetical protein